MCVFVRTERVLCEIYDETNRGESLKRRKILDAPPVCDFAINAVMMVYDHINIFYV